MVHDRMNSSAGDAPMRMRMITASDVSVVIVITASDTPIRMIVITASDAPIVISVCVMMMIATGASPIVTRC